MDEDEEGHNPEGDYSSQGDQFQPTLVFLPTQWSSRHSTTLSLDHKSSSRRIDISKGLYVQLILFTSSRDSRNMAKKRPLSLPTNLHMGII